MALGSSLRSQGFRSPDQPPVWLAVMPPLSKSGASSEHQVTPSLSLETSSQRCMAIQLRLPAAHWSFSTSITPQGMSTRVVACGMSKPKPKWTPSLGSERQFVHDIADLHPRLAGDEAHGAGNGAAAGAWEETRNSTTSGPDSTVEWRCRRLAWALSLSPGIQRKALRPPLTQGPRSCGQWRDSRGG